MKRLCLPLLLLMVSACGHGRPACPETPAGDVVYIVESSWHTEIGIPVSELDGDMLFFKGAFPGARVIMFGYGKKTFFTAPPNSVSEYFLGPVPGPAVLHTVGLSVTPPEAYDPSYTTTLALPPGGKEALSAYIWEDLIKDEEGRPKFVARSHNPEGTFYAADSEYNLLHTCNSWAADALHDAKLPVSGHWVTFSGGVMDQVNDAARNQCESLLGRGHGAGRGHDNGGL